MAVEIGLRIWCVRFIRGVIMSQPHALSVEVPVSASKLPVVTDKVVKGPRVANTVDSPIASPVHILQDKLQQLDEPKHGEETAYAYNVAKAPAWVRMALPVSLSIALWAGILYVVGAID
ncbi:hypothetical protein [Novosphingobium sp.]|uniref:hypothetical protein n=1 Tax=Novosphingobium sp. TaxID=1874826 RepID=UPI0035633EBD